MLANNGLKTTRKGIIFNQFDSTILLVPSFRPTKRIGPHTRRTVVDVLTTQDEVFFRVHYPQCRFRGSLPLSHQ